MGIQKGRLPIFRARLNQTQQIFTSACSLKGSGPMWDAQITLREGTRRPGFATGGLSPPRRQHGESLLGPHLDAERRSSKRSEGNRERQERRLRRRSSGGRVSHGALRVRRVQHGVGSRLTLCQRIVAGIQWDLIPSARRRARGAGT
jgi:hypothetical protein